MQQFLVSLGLMNHRHQQCIAIHFKPDDTILLRIKELVAVKWSRTLGCWYTGFTIENYRLLQQALKGVTVASEAELVELCKEIVDKAQESKNLLLPVFVKSSIAPSREKSVAGSNIHHVNAHVLPRLTEQLKLKAYSISTIRTYCNEMRQLLVLLKDHPADNLTVEQLRRYLVYCTDKLRLHENTLHSRINALKFYYEQVLGHDKFFFLIPRPKKQLAMPRFFSQEDIVAILKAETNLKHRIMLMLVYSAGLRVSEVVKLKPQHIDSNRMCIRIERAKGKKDRIVTLSPVALVLLREYWKKYQPAVDGYLFEGQRKGEPYSTRSLQMVLQQAKKRAGILKPGSVHALRHSFATHLLDKGTDVTMIMKLLGHNNIRTTMRYLHVTNKDLLKIISPLDSLGDIFTQ